MFALVEVNRSAKLFENLERIMKYVSYTVAFVLALVFSGVSAVYWNEELSAQPDIVRYMAIVGSVCLSLLGPVAASQAKKAPFILVAVVVFIGCDCYQNAQGYETFKGFNGAEELEAAEARLSAARAELAALPLPSATGEIRRVSTWETLNDTLQGRVEAAKNEVAELSAPSAPLWKTFIVMLVVQGSLALLFALVGDDEEARKAKAEAKKKAKAKAKRAKAAKKGWKNVKKKAAQAEVSGRKAAKAA